MPFAIYKSGQGRYVRVGTAIGVALVAMAITYYAWLILELYISKGSALAPYKIYLEYIIPALVFVVLAVVAAIYLNRPGAVDFFVATESEMKKVSWSSWPELSGSTIVVIMTVFMLAIFIYVVDYVITGGLARGWTIPFTQIHVPGLGLW